jgi:hypothetical protein
VMGTPVGYGRIRKVGDGIATLFMKCVDGLRLSVRKICRV